jgi:hypothetical protein
VLIPPHHGAGHLQRGALLPGLGEVPIAHAHDQVEVAGGVGVPWANEPSRMAPSNTLLAVMCSSSAASMVRGFDSKVLHTGELRVVACSRCAARGRR